MAEKQKPSNKEQRKKAIALRYDRGKDSAPKVIGKGAGEVAERLIAIAREHGIPVHEDTDLIEILSRLNLNEAIPPSTYVIVAEILAFIYRANENFKS